MSGITTDLLVNVGLVLIGVLIRGHAPKLWPLVAPFFGSGPTPPLPPSASQG